VVAVSALVASSADEPLGASLEFGAPAADPSSDFNLSSFTRVATAQSSCVLMRCTLAGDEVEGGGLREAGAHDRDQCAPALAANALIGATRPASAAPNYVAKDCPLRTRSRDACVKYLACKTAALKIQSLGAACCVAVSIGIVIRFLLQRGFESVVVGG
jgi:hypothetical protein